MLSIGVDIGGTKVAAGVVAPSGEVLERVTVPSPTSSPVSVEDAIIDVVAQLRAAHTVSSVGIGAAGWVDSEQALIRFSPHLAWRNEPLRDRLRTRIDLPVIVDNDANAAAWAEYRFGAGRGARVMVCITLGTGIGGALVVDGRVFRGTYGMAGEWGHMTVVPDGHWCACGNRGCWEQYASGNALVREANGLIQSGAPQAAALAAAAGADGITGPGVTAVALAGDRPAGELITDVGAWLGRGMANLAAALDPELFVVGGGVSEADGLLLQPAIDAYARSLTGRGYRPVARIALAHFRNDAGMIGAADLARYAIAEPPGRVSVFWPWRKSRTGNTMRRLRREF